MVFLIFKNIYLFIYLFIEMNFVVENIWSWGAAEVLKTLL
jgi:hypothetical protein